MQMSETERLRAEQERQQRDIHGAGTKQDWLSKLDERLCYSGIKDKFTWLTTEMYVIVVAIVTAVITTVVTVFASLLQGVIAAAVTILMFKLVIVLMSNSRDKRTEAQLLQFMNIIDNFSKTSNDLIDILDKASRYIDEPLSSQIYNAVQEARNSGDSLTALRSLQSNVKNKHFKILIQNLETSSRLENNYSDIIEDCREIFHTYIRAQKEKRSVRMNGMFEILMMIGVGLICVSMIGDMADEGNIIDMLLNNGTIGVALFIILAAALVFSLYMAIFKVLKTDD
jgi:Flp pilus assembly protein TadB